MVNFVCERFGKFWNDPEFRDLYNSLLEYTLQLADSQDVGLEWFDTLILLMVEAYQVEYGENWRDYCPQEIQDYYDEMNRTEDQSGGNTNQSDSGGCDENPPQTGVEPNIFTI